MSVFKERYEEAFEILESFKSIPDVDNGDVNKIKYIICYQREMMSVYTNAVMNLVSEKVKDQDED